MNVREVRGKTFVKLMRQECGEVVYKWLDCIEQVQLRAYRIFLGVGRLHPKTSVQIEEGSDRIG